MGIYTGCIKHGWSKDSPNYCRICDPRKDATPQAYYPYGKRSDNPLVRFIEMHFESLLVGSFFIAMAVLLLKN